MALTLDQPKTAQKPGSDALAGLLARGRPLVMGILNVTPDSFSDGGRFLDPRVAIAHAEEMAAQGADILDIGAESTRPYGGMQPVAAAEEKARLASGAAGGRRSSACRCRSTPSRRRPPPGRSIRARQSSTTSGACSAIPIWRSSWRARNVPVIVMHNRTTADPALDIIAEVNAFFERSLAIAARAGIARDKIVLDPGIGFGKTAEQSIACIARLAAFKHFGLPLLVGASRKRFIDSVTPAPPSERIGGSLAAHLLAVENGAAIVRVHDVAETVQALRVRSAIEAAR